MIANSNAGKNMNVTTTAANSIVANSTNINSRIISTLDGHPRVFFMSRHSKTWPNYYQFTVMSLQTWCSARYCVHIIALAHTLRQLWKLADSSAPHSVGEGHMPFPAPSPSMSHLHLSFTPSVYSSKSGTPYVLQTDHCPGLHERFSSSRLAIICPGIANRELQRANCNSRTCNVFWLEANATIGNSKSKSSFTGFGTICGYNTIMHAIIFTIFSMTPAYEGWPLDHRPQTSMPP